MRLLKLGDLYIGLNKVYFIISALHIVTTTRYGTLGPTQPPIQWVADLYPGS